MNKKVAFTSNEPDPEWHIDMISSISLPWVMYVKLPLSSQDYKGQQRHLETIVLLYNLLQAQWASRTLGAHINIKKLKTAGDILWQNSCT